MIFSEENGEKDIDEEMESDEENLSENIKGNTTIIEIKLFESYNGGYLVRFVKKEGELSDYLDKLEKIYSFIKNN